MYVHVDVVWIFLVVVVMDVMMWQSGFNAESASLIEI